MGKNIQRRNSPNKERVSPPRTQSIPFDFPTKKQSQTTFEEPTKKPTIHDSQTTTTPFDDLLTPEILLSSYQAKKTGNQTQQPTQPAKVVNILDLLSKKDNLEKIANVVSQAVDASNQQQQPPRKDDQRFHSPPRKLTNSKSNPSPPQTPKTSMGERFAGLSSSPAPCNLPQPSFHFLDQELRKEESERYSTPIQFNRNQPIQHRPQQQSPPTNPHLDELTSNLKMMLNIPVHS
eukprot:TRINITY_DN6138_c0_g1_i2.p1 TRINITY_DN6138_c0_g1~~TRINITY_DN6138_c0_g1_i2.p1  ORF type:complete len:234 (+),score=48.70 TRINITY_DN6138_c0_g1_i2:145-846(+)